MRRVRSWPAMLLAILAAAVILPACKTYDQGADPFVVEAERTVNIGFHVVDAFVTWERVNRSAVPPKVYEAAEKLRTEFPRFHDAAVSAISAYKASRSEPDKAAVTESLAPVTERKDQALLLMPTVVARQAYAEAGESFK